MKKGGDPNKGITALRKVAPEVVERMGYEEGGDVEANKSEIEGLPLTNYILSLSKPEQSEFKKALIGVAGITVGSVESIPMLVKRLVETGSLKKKEVQEVIQDKVQENEERITKAMGGNIENQMSMLIGPQQELPETEMESDSEMEDNYLDFIIDEALDEEEEDMLMSKLEQDEQLSMLFDKVLEVASEFAGSGPVEGPGSGVSDSIPARLSDGEFVFTAKATEQIGADELMRMMKDAEAAADRQGMQEGGMMMEEEEVDQFGRPIDSDIARDELKKNMMSVNPRYR